MNTRPKLYGRLGYLRDVERVLCDAKLCTGTTVKRDLDAGTVEMTIRGRLAFKALQKGEKSPIWLCMYSPEFYPRDEDEQKLALIAHCEAAAASDGPAGFYLVNSAGVHYGANGRAQLRPDALQLVALPKFKTMAAVKAFVRWAGLRGFWPCTLIPKGYPV